MTTTPVRLAGIPDNRAGMFPAGPAWWTKPAAGIIGQLETHSENEEMIAAVNAIYAIA